MTLTLTAAPIRATGMATKPIEQVKAIAGSGSSGLAKLAQAELRSRMVRDLQRAVR
jgi:hypothetical protein